MRSVALGLALLMGLAAPAFAQSANPFNGFYAGGHAGYGWGEREGCFAIGSPSASADCSAPIPAVAAKTTSTQICATDSFTIQSPRDNCCQAQGSAKTVVPTNNCQPQSYNIPFDYKQNGWLAGGQAGFNRVFGNAGGLVLGAEVSASIAAISGVLDLGPFSGLGQYKWLGTGTAKIGFAGQNFLVYAEGGIGLGGFQFSSPLCSFDSLNRGLVYGAGAEVFIAPKNTLFVEWNRFNFDRKDASCSFQLGGFVIPVGVSTKATLDVVKFGFNHFFN